MKLIEFSNNFPSNLLDKLIKKKNNISSTRLWYIKKDVLQCTYDIPTNEILVYNLGHNILELYYDLVHIQLTTSKTKHDMSSLILGKRVASQAAERLEA